MQCKKCNKSFPCSLIIDGKKRYLKNRKFCLECSPFGSHNTRQLNLDRPGIFTVRNCKRCGKEIVRKNEKGDICWVCTNREGRKNKIEKIKKLTGNACWFCGYDKCWQAMDFHHVDPSIKSISLTAREFQLAWERIEQEVRKCVLSCCRCHREIHAGLIKPEMVIQTWQDKWSAIKQDNL